MSEEPTEQQHQITTFRDQVSDWAYSVGSSPDPTYSVSDTNDADLNNFFSRPIRIATYDWSTSTSNVYQTFNPWTLFFENKRVMNRISNYNLMRAKLKVKVVINGNSFHYGRAIVAYTPLPSYDEFRKARPGINNFDLTALSQRPHIYLNPTKSQGGTLELPFFWFNNYLEIPKNEWSEMGDITISTLSILKHANGATDNVTISVFAWAEDVVLSIPTSNEPESLVPQGGHEIVRPKAYNRYRNSPTRVPSFYEDEFVVPEIDCSPASTISSPPRMYQSAYHTDWRSPHRRQSFKPRYFQGASLEYATCQHCGRSTIIENPMYKPHAGDEYGQSPISKPATVVSRVAGMLRNAPIIGMYARATELASSAIAEIARVFGYSRPAILADIVPYRPTYVGNMANTNVPDSVTKLTLDAKQELCIDPRTMGLSDTDEMTIKSIAMRESYLTSFVWDMTDVEETLLFNAVVNPVTWRKANDGGNTELHLPACAFAANPFKYWRGTVRYRFVVVASAYHKGRIKIVYDPQYMASNEYNTNYTRVIDISQTTDFTVEVGWGSPKPFLEHRVIRTYLDPLYGPTPITTSPGDYGNGVLSVYVVNELTTPNSTMDNSIDIQVFISAGDDFEVAVPDEMHLTELTPLEPQGGVMEPQSGEMTHPDAVSTEDDAAPMNSVVEETIANKVDNTDATYHVFFGDPVVSLRQVFKRYNLHSVEVPGQNSIGRARFRNSNFPYYGGYHPNGVDNVTTPSDPTPYNFARSTMLNYFTPAFAAWRGGIRWKEVATSANSFSLYTFDLSVQNTISEEGVFVSRNVKALADLSSGANIARHSQTYNTPTLINGGHVTVPGKNPVLEYEIPFYSSRRFTPARISNVTSDPLHKFHDTTIHGNFTSAGRIALKRFVSTGEDFMLAFYIGPPIFYATGSPSPSA